MANAAFQPVVDAWNRLTNSAAGAGRAVGGTAKGASVGVAVTPVAKSMNGVSRIFNIAERNPWLAIGAILTAIGVPTIAFFTKSHKADRQAAEAESLAAQIDQMRAQRVAASASVGNPEASTAHVAGLQQKAQAEAGVAL